MIALGFVLVTLVPAAVSSAAAVTQENPRTHVGGGTRGSGPAVAPPAPEVAPLARGIQVGPRPLPELLTRFEGAQVDRVLRTSPDGAPLRASYVRSGTQIDHGPDLRWHVNGGLAISRTWREGRQDGLTEEWHESGFQKTSARWVADLREGPYTQWYEDGAPRAARSYAAGLQEGRAVEWWPDGSVRSIAEWRDGRQHGESITCRAGRMTVRGAYDAGRRHGRWEEYDGEGRVVLAGTYVLGQEDGAWIRHDEAGSRIEETYVLGRLDGERRVIAEDGTVVARGSYVEGKAHGLAREWFASGKPKSEITFVDGVQDGPVRYWFESGAVQIEGTMRAGKREGAWTYWKEDGARDPTWSGTYKDDKKVSD